MLSLFEQRETEFSPDRKYRYRLRQIWEPKTLSLVVCLLNPSIADEFLNDPTVERCERRARTMGFGSLEVVNVFAFRSTDPEGLCRIDDPIGPDNDFHILEAARNAGMLLVGWGKHGQLMNRGNKVLDLLRRNNIEPYCLKINSDSSPVHPLYIGYDVKPFLYIPSQ